MSDSYDELAAALLAQIADRLLGGKPDWRSLERLAAVLAPPSEVVAPALDRVTKSYVDAQSEPQFGRITYGYLHKTNTYDPNLRYEGPR